MPLTPAQQALAKKHGTPVEFRAALLKAAWKGAITTEELVNAANKYQQEWDVAGGLVSLSPVVHLLLVDALDHFKNARIGVEVGCEPATISAYVTAGEKAIQRAEALSKEGPNLKLEVYQQDWIPGFAAFNDDGSVQQGTAHICINVGAFMAGIQTKDFTRAELPYVIAESLMHEFVHVLEAWAKVEFDDAKIETLIARYQKMYEDELPPDPNEGEDWGIKPGQTVSGVGVVQANLNDAPWPVDQDGNQFCGCVYVTPTYSPKEGIRSGPRYCDALTGKVLTDEEFQLRKNALHFNYFQRYKVTA